MTFAAEACGSESWKGPYIDGTEVEQALKAHPAIFDALVAGAKDPKYGERVSAVVSLREGFDEPSPEELAEHCRASLAGYKIPRSVIVVPEVLRSPSGKADYRWAKRMVADDDVAV